MDVGNIQATLTLSTAQFNQSLQSAQNQMANTSQSAKKVSKDIALIHKAALGMGAALAVGVGAAVKTAADFEQAMANVKAVSGASASEMDQLSQAAKDFAETSQYNAVQIAGGMEELIKAGLTTSQVIGGGLKGALDLAAAGGISLKDAAEVASTALNAFKKDSLSVSDAANILAGAANASATDVGEMRFGLSMVSAVASGVGLTFKDTASTLALFAQNGLKGSDAGTSLKTMLLNLIPQTKKEAKLFDELGVTVKGSSNAFFDAHGNIKSMSEIAQILQDKLKHLTNEQRQATLAQMFGTDAIRAGNILYKEGAKGLNEMTTAMMKIKAADVAAVKMDTLKGAFKEFQAVLQNVGITVGDELLPAFTDIVRFASDLVRKFGDVDGTTIKVGLAMASASTAILLVGSTIAKLSVALRAFALTPVGAAITALSILGGVIAGVVVHQNEMKEVNLETAESMMKQADELGATTKQYEELRAKSKLSNEELGRFVDINSLISKTADPNVISRLSSEQESLRKKSGLSNEELDTMVRLNGELIEKVPEATTQISAQGNAILTSTDKIKAYNQQQYERIRLELDAQKAKAEANMSDYLAKETEELKRINGLKEKMAGYDTKEIDQRKKVKDLYDDLATAKANKDSLEIERLNTTIEREEHKLGAIKKQRAETAGLLVDRTKEMDKIQAQIGKLDEVKRKMVDLELRQAGINAKRGEEVRTIDSAITKLNAQKAALEKSVPVNQRNTAEYRAARDAIQQQINKLQGTKSKVEEIIGKAQAMNAELGKDVSKNFTVYQNAVASKDFNNYKANAMKYHTGGIVGKPPQLHVGGLASQFANAPSHNEIDVRLLRNEAVLTEAQQSNLMRMIDAGQTGGNTSPFSAGEIADIKSLLGAIAQNTAQSPSVVVDGNALWNYVDTKQATETRMQNRNGGVKR